jgi:hypothetical protein
MDNNEKTKDDKEGNEIFETVVKKVISGISTNVQKKYEGIDLDKIPDHVNYSKVEKYLRSVNIEITRKMFFSYLKENLVPSEHEVKNRNFSYYTRDQIIYYILVDMFKPILPLSKVKTLLNDVLKPTIDDMGLEFTYKALCDMTSYMASRFEEAVATAIKEEQSRLKGISVKMPEETDDETKKVEYHIAHYATLMTLCMARGALDFYKLSPNTLLE